LWQTIAASIAAEILVAPLIIYYFHLFPLLFIISNVLAFLFMGIVLVLGMLVVVFSGISSIASALAAVTTFIAVHFNALVYKLQTFNPTPFHFLSLSVIELLILYCCIAGLVVFLLKKRKNALFLSIASCCILLCLLCTDEWAALHQSRLVVYNINHTAQVELIRGKYYSILHTDTVITQDKKDYTLKPAHTAWHAWQQSPAINNEILSFGKYKVLLLNEDLPYTSRPFPVDYIIINYKSNNINLEQLQHIFSPKLIILAANNSRKTIEKCLDAATMSHIQVHAVSDKGAFILDEF
ncbi:MAG: ComEC/Rec2 family competence protein, partial [Bacteroidetes bacterium]|nr:ComEC/Rec2 family competence protein [Bacteroidota bacterium]